MDSSDEMYVCKYISLQSIQYIEMLMYFGNVMEKNDKTEITHVQVCIYGNIFRFNLLYSE